MKDLNNWRAAAAEPDFDIEIQKNPYLREEWAQYLKSEMRWLRIAHIREWIKIQAATSLAKRENVPFAGALSAIRRQHLQCEVK